MRSRRPRVSAISASLGALALWTTPLFAQDADSVGDHTVMIVVDSSNSMWGQINGEPKIVFARRAISDLMADWNPSVPVGLVAYGHREDQSCEDVSTVVSIGAEPATVAAAAGALRPNGLSPLTEAIQHAAEALNATDQPATIVLVTDGIESCDLDPCETATMLEAESERLTIHAVDLTTPADQEESQLRCIVDATGGEVVSPANVSALLPDLEEFLGLRIFEAGAQAGDPRFIISPHNGRLVEVYHGEGRFAVHEASQNLLDLEARDVFFAPRPSERGEFDPAAIAIRFSGEENRVLLLWWTQSEDGVPRLNSHEIMRDGDLPAQILWMAPRLVRVAFGETMRDPRVIRLQTDPGETPPYRELLIAP